MSATAAKPALKSLKCTQCGGSIEIRGGHNVRSIVCQYCGACMDTKDSFKVLHQFLNQKRPFMPLKLGAKGKLKGVLFTVIGVIQKEQKDSDGIYRWLEYLLFSPTHGYVYLDYSDGHWGMTHEVKDLPETDVDLVMPRKSSFKVRDRTFKVFESGGAQVSYVEGELTWEAKQNEKVRFIEAICPPYSYAIEHRGCEQEYFWGEYIPHTEIAEAFKIQTVEPTTIAPSQPFSGSPIVEAFSKGALAASVLALVFYFLISSSGKPVMRHSFGPQAFKDVEISKEFKVEKPDELYSIVVDSTKHVNNSWAFFDVKVIDKAETEMLFSMPTSISYYSGYEGGEHWSEGRKKVEAYFKIPDKGEFKLAVTGEGAQGNSNAANPNFSLSNVAVLIRRGARLGHFTLTWFFLSLLISLPYFLMKASFEQRRWADEDEDDD